MGGINLTNKSYGLIGYFRILCQLQVSKLDGGSRTFECVLWFIRRSMMLFSLLADCLSESRACPSHSICLQPSEPGPEISLWISSSLTPIGARKQQGKSGGGRARSIVALPGAPSGCICSSYAGRNQKWGGAKWEQGYRLGHGAVLAHEPLRNTKILSFCIPFEGILVEKGS